MKMSKTISVVLAFLALTASFSALADHDDRRFRGRYVGPRVWRGDIRNFHRWDMDRWRGGYWVHAHHDGRWGWWWVVAGLWYFYPRPIYPYPDPYTPPYVPAVPVLPAPSAPPEVQYWYYCNGAKGYYPYVQSCPGGWRRVPATPSAPPGQ
ncbi:MAG: hypothetical protein M0Z84_05295 [Gammaproteobacteria bacterium]|nr:hypothetical protein [Gammaproteobacteria bacterium]